MVAQITEGRNSHRIQREAPMSPPTYSTAKTARGMFCVTAGMGMSG
jgi:hypothetical protein